MHSGSGPQMPVLAAQAEGPCRSQLASRSMTLEHQSLDHNTHPALQALYSSRSAPASSARASKRDKDVIYRLAECKSAHCRMVVMIPASGTTAACSKCLDLPLRGCCLLWFLRAPNHAQLARVRTEPGVSG